MLQRPYRYTPLTELRRLERKGKGKYNEWVLMDCTAMWFFRRKIAIFISVIMYLGPLYFTST